MTKWYPHPSHHQVDPTGIESIDGLIAELNNLRRQAAFGTGKARVSIDDIARATGIPRSTVHVYVSGRVLPPGDALAQIVAHLGADRREVLAWLAALERLEAEPARRPGGAAAPDAWRAGAPRQVPPLTTNFVGREPELRALDAALSREGGLGHLIALVGTGGVGKTSIVAQWASGHLEGYPDGTLYVDLRGYSSQEPLDPNRTLTRFLGALGMAQDALPADGEDLSDLYRSTVASRRLLIVLDNAHDDRQVEPLLPGTTRSDVIVTSRDALRTLVVQHGAIRLPVGPLPDEDSRKLFSGLPYAPAHVQAVLGLCAGLPLALQVVRERAAVLGSLEGLLEEIRGGESLLDVLATDRGADGGVRDIVAWSYRGLPPSTQAFFRLIATLPGPRVSLDTVAALAGFSRVEARRELESLGQSSLLTPVSAEHWTRHDILTAFGQERLHAELSPGEIRTARARVIGYYLALLDGATTNHDSLILPWPASVPRFDVGLSRREAWRRALEEEDTMIAVASQAADDGQVGEVLALAERGIWAYEEYRVPMRSSLADAALRLAQRSGDKLAEATLYLRLGEYYTRRTELKKGQELLQHAVEAGRRLEDDDITVAALNASGLAATYSGEYERAEQLLLAALDRVSPDRPHELSTIHLSLGILYDAFGDRDAIERHYRAAAVPGPDGTVPISGLLGLVNLTSSEIDAGNLENAGRILDELHAIPNAREPSRALSPMLLAEAQWAAATRSFDLARTLLAEVAGLAERHGDRGLTMQMLHVAADVADLSGDDEEAVELFCRTIAQTVDRKLPFDESLVRYKLARVYERLGLLDEALTEYATALAVAEPLGLPGPIVDDPTEGVRRVEAALNRRAGEGRPDDPRG